MSPETLSQASDQPGDNVYLPTPRTHGKQNARTHGGKTNDYHLTEGVSFLTTAYKQFVNKPIEDCINNGFPSSFLRCRNPQATVSSINADISTSEPGRSYLQATDGLGPASFPSSYGEFADVRIGVIINYAPEDELDKNGNPTLHFQRDVDGNFYNVTMRNLFTTMRMMMCHAGFHADVAMLILLASVVVMDMCMLMGPASGWSDTEEYRLLSQFQLPCAKNIIEYVLGKCENLVGVMVFGQKATDNILPWLRDKYAKNLLIQGSDVFLSHPQNIQWCYTLKHAQHYVETFRAIMALLGVDIPSLDGHVQLRFLMTKKRSLEMMECVEGFGNSEVLESVQHRTNKVNIARMAKVEALRRKEMEEAVGPTAAAAAAAAVAAVKEMQEAATVAAAAAAAADVAAVVARMKEMQEAEVAASAAAVAAAVAAVDTSMKEMQEAATVAAAAVLVAAPKSQQRKESGATRASNLTAAGALRQCYNKWPNLLTTAGTPRIRQYYTKWSEEEDAIVLRFISTNGMIGNLAAGAEEEEEHRESSSTSSSNGNASISTFTQWADLVPQLPGRTKYQIRKRWANFLNPAIKHLPFSRDDDLQLWWGHCYLGKRWVEISVKVFHSTRSDDHIKSRWYSPAFKKFVAKEFGVDAYLNAKQTQAGDEGGGGA